MEITGSFNPRTEDDGIFPSVTYEYTLVIDEETNVPALVKVSAISYDNVNNDYYRDTALFDVTLHEEGD